MKIDYLFSYRQKLGSWLISWAAESEGLSLDKNPSHMAILIDDTWVIESTFFNGVSISPYSKWKKRNIELYKIPDWQAYRRSKEVLTRLTHVWGKGYDWLGIAYFGICYVKLMVFGTALPKRNRWQRPNRYFCTEYAALLSGEDFSMRSPASICNQWLQELL